MTATREDVPPTTTWQEGVTAFGVWMTMADFQMLLNLRENGIAALEESDPTPLAAELVTTGLPLIRITITNPNWQGAVGIAIFTGHFAFIFPWVAGGGGIWEVIINGEPADTSGWGYAEWEAVLSTPPAVECVLRERTFRMVPGPSASWHGVNTGSMDVAFVLPNFFDWSPISVGTVAAATLWVVNVGSVTIRDWANDQTYEIYRDENSTYENPLIGGWATITPSTTLTMMAHLNPTAAPTWPTSKPQWLNLDGPETLEFSNPYGTPLTQVYVDESGSYAIAASSSLPCLIGLWATAPPLALVAVDANNDGVIEFDENDATGSLTSGAPSLTPFRFWVDGDRPPVSAYSGPPNPGNPSRINNAEVLENYCRLHVVPPAGFDPETGKCTMKFVKDQNSKQQPSIRVFEVRNEDLSYLTSLSGADTVANDLWSPWAGDNSKYPYTTVADEEKAVSVAYHDPNRDRLSFLFAGMTPGRGKLVVRFKDPSRQPNIIAEGEVWIELLPIDRMFDRAHIIDPAGQSPQGFDPTRDLYKKFQIDLIPPPYFSQTPQPPKPAYVFLKHFDHPTNPTGAPCQGHECPDAMSAHPRETGTAIIYTHGMWELDSDFFSRRARKTFKRLYWSGYNGRFVAFHWANLAAALSIKNPLDKFSYNRSEYNAFICADTFKDFVADVRAKTRYQSVNVMAHSQGNIMISEAIKLGANVTNYVLMEAAVSASCYDGSTLTMPNYPRLYEKSDDPDKKLRQAPNKYPGYFAGITAGNIVNFFSEEDPALQTGDIFWGLMETNWVVNQIQFKPDGPFTTHNGNKKITATYEYTQDAQQQWQSNLKQRQWVRNAFDRWEGPTEIWARSFPAEPSYEELAFAARSRTRAIGAILPANALTIRGSIKGNVDLRSDSLPEAIRFGRTDHSGQFSRPIQKCFWFYWYVLRAFNTGRIPRPDDVPDGLLQMN